MPTPCPHAPWVASASPRNRDIAVSLRPSYYTVHPAVNKAQPLEPAPEAAWRGCAECRGILAKLSEHCAAHVRTLGSQRPPPSSGNTCKLLRRIGGAPPASSLHHWDSARAPGGWNSSPATR